MAAQASALHLDVENAHQAALSQDAGHCRLRMTWFFQGMSFAALMLIGVAAMDHAGSSYGSKRPSGHDAALASWAGSSLPTIRTGGVPQATSLAVRGEVPVMPVMQAPVSRRSFSGLLGSGMLAAALVPLSASADTQAEMEGTMPKFDEGEEKRKRFQEKQKEFKKEWRKQLGNLEFCSNDVEALDAIDKLSKLIILNGNQIPEGIRKQDLDQVYKIVQNKLQKDTRLKFMVLDATVQKIVTVKSMANNYEME